MSLRLSNPNIIVNAGANTTVTMKPLGANNSLTMKPLGANTTVTMKPLGANTAVTMKPLGVNNGQINSATSTTTIIKQIKVFDYLSISINLSIYSSIYP